MIEEVFANSSELSRGIFDPFYGKFIEDKIRDKITAGQGGTVSDSAIVEFSIYDGENSLLYWDTVDYEVTEKEYILPVNKHIAESSVPNGADYTLRYNFFKSKLSGPDKDQKMYIQSFSDDRREVRVRPTPNSDFSFRESVRSVFGKKVRTSLKNVANFNRNQYYRILSWSSVAKTDSNGDVLFDENNDPELTNSAIIRFENAIPSAIEVGDEFWIGERLSRPYFDKFEIFRSVEPTPTNELAPPDFNIDTGENSIGESKFEDLESIIDEGSSSENFVQSTFGDGSVDLNVDYTEFENFVHFSSAEERIKNFRFKLKKIQQFIKEIKDDGTSAGRKKTARREAESIIATFDSYEKFLFRAENVPESYPKNEDGSLVDLEITTKKGTVPSGLDNPTGWFKKIIERARRYDDRNESSLKKQIPDYIREDPENESFVLFVNMVAQWFDQNWLFIDQFENFSKVTESAFQPDSLSADLSQIISESMGIETFNGFDAEQFFDELFESSKLEDIFDGANISESLGIEVDENVLDLTRYNAQQQVWRRLLSNLIHHYKTRGTENSIRMLGNIFGFPTGSIVVREYGGGVVGSDKKDIKIEENTHNLSFFSSQNLRVPWSTSGGSGSVNEYENLFDNFEDSPKSGMVRFASEYQGGQSLRLFEITDVLEVRIDPAGLGDTDQAKIVLEILLADGNRVQTKTDSFPILNGRYTNVLIKIREDKPFVDVLVQQRSPIGEIVSVGGTSINIDLRTAKNYLNGQEIKIGGSVNDSLFGEGVPFIGKLDQVNIWKKNISEERFDTHTLAPTKQDVDNSSLTYRDDVFNERENFIRKELLFRLDFPTAQNLSKDPIIENESDFFGGSAVAQGFQERDEEPWQFDRYSRVSLFPTVQVGATSFFTKKIRIEDNELNAPLQLNENQETRSQELITEDSEKLGIFFSPYTSANRDLFSEIGIRNINSILGNPKDQIEGRYDSLNAINRMYWEKYDRPINRQDYIRYIDEFYDAFFEHIRKSIPARATLIDGIVIEPTILERDREAFPISEVKTEKLSASINARPETEAEITQALDVRGFILDVNTFGEDRESSQVEDELEIETEKID